MATLGGGLLMGIAASPMPSQSIPETTKTLLATPRPRWNPICDFSSSQSRSDSLGSFVSLSAPSSPVTPQPCTPSPGKTRAYTPTSLNQTILCPLSWQLLLLPTLSWSSSPGMFSRTTVPNLFGTRDQFCGRQFFHRLGTWRVVWDDSSTFIVHFVVAFVQSLSHVRLCDPWTAAHQASLSFAISQSLLKLMSVELVMPSSHLILFLPLLLLPVIVSSAPREVIRH